MLSGKRLGQLFSNVSLVNFDNTISDKGQSWLGLGLRQQWFITNNKGSGERMEAGIFHFSRGRIFSNVFQPEICQKLSIFTLCFYILKCAVSCVTFKLSRWSRFTNSYSSVSQAIFLDVWTGCSLIVKKHKGGQQWRLNWLELTSKDWESSSVYLDSSD